MLKNLLLIGFLIVLGCGRSYGQNNGALKVRLLKNNIEILPGEVVNLPVIIENPSQITIDFEVELQVPQGWKAILGNRQEILKPGENKMIVFSVQSASVSVVADFELLATFTSKSTGKVIGTMPVLVNVKEYENISMMMVNAAEHVQAGEVMKANFLVQNNGNTKKKVYLEAVNCEVDGTNEIEVEAGKSVEFKVLAKTKEDAGETYNSYIGVRASVGDKIYESVHHPYLVFPQEKLKKDLYFRYPVKLSASYIFSNTTGESLSGYQFEAFGSGYLDVEKKHLLEFLARGPDNQDLGFMGVYDQYYINYQNEVVNATLGEKAYQFTELTEMSRFGLGAETRIKTRNGIKVGAIYVQPRFYDEIEHEFGAFTGYEFSKDNYIDLFYVAKDVSASSQNIHLLSLTGSLTPFKDTYWAFEVSGGRTDGSWDKAFKSNLNTRFSIFQLAGNYYFAGEKYPGYYNNSKFYSGNITARLTKKLSIGAFAKEDFQNAQLDTFFVTAPYSKSYQAILNYNPGRKAYFKFFWRNYERKDRLSDEKFHYKTQSVNTQFRHRYKAFDYSLLGEYGKTTNYQLNEVNNEQNTYRVNGNLGYLINGKHNLQVFGSWSNVNSFITDEQRNLTWGASASMVFSRNFRAMLYFQNAYNIEDYYQNRNLMQATIDYTFLKNHTLSLRSFYTLFKRETENPELAASVTYTYNLGIPLKQVIQAGDLNGVISYDDGTPAEGIILKLLNNKAITNKNGEFSFNAIQPGRHLLYVNNEQLEIDELTNIPVPAQVEIIGNEQSAIHFKITKGARFSGQFNSQPAENENTGGNIVVELKSEFDQFRIASNTDGRFAFPMVRPGQYLFKIYSGSLPEGYSVKPTEYRFELKPGENKHLDIELSKRKRNIIFSSNDFVLTPISSNNKLDIDEGLTRSVPAADGSLYYAIQVGAFRKAKKKDMRFFAKYPYDFEKHVDGYYKYFIGNYKSLNEAKQALKNIQQHYRNPFIVTFSDGEIAKPKNEGYASKEMFYSVQVGAFRFKKTNQSRYFSEYPFEFERYSNNLNKYFIGKFNQIEDARELRKKLSQYYRNPFVVHFKNGTIKPVR